jgi:hypothetical protein
MQWFHAAHHRRISRMYSMSEPAQGDETGREAYEALWHATMPALNAYTFCPAGSSALPALSITSSRAVLLGF